MSLLKSLKGSILLFWRWRNILVPWVVLQYNQRLCANNTDIDVGLCTIQTPITATINKLLMQFIISFSNSHEQIQRPHLSTQIYSFFPKIYCLGGDALAFMPIAQRLMVVKWFSNCTLCKNFQNKCWRGTSFGFGSVDILRIIFNQQFTSWERITVWRVKV